VRASGEGPVFTGSLPDGWASLLAAMSGLGSGPKNLDRFEQAAQRAFAFLERDFGLTFEPDSTDEWRKHWWVRYLTYRNDGAFVRIELDDRDRAFNILVGPVVVGELPPYPIFLEREDEPVTWFPVWAILRGRGEPEPPFSFAQDERLDDELDAWAAALREHARPALRGDFDELREPVRRAKRQQAEAARERDERRSGPLD
jgi:hypothetical protein